MTKPNDFTLNTDYLPLVQITSTEFTAYFPAESFPSGLTPNVRTQDFTVSPMQGAIDTYYMSLNGADFVIGPYISILRGGPYLHITAYRLNPTTIRVKLFEIGEYQMPAQTVRIKVDSFIQPDAF